MPFEQMVPAPARCTKADRAPIARAILTLIILVALSACSSGTATSTSTLATQTGSLNSVSAETSTTTSSGLRLVSLGDSDAGIQGDSEGKGWVARYAALLEKQTGQHIEVLDRAQEGQTSDKILKGLQTDQALRSDIEAADVVVIGAGGADMNAGDAAWSAGSCSGRSCYQPALAAYARNMRSATGVVAQLRAGRPTLLRAMTLPNVLPGAEDVIPPFLVPDATSIGVFQAQSLRTSTCDAVRAVGGQCIDVLTAFNGPRGTQNAYRSGLLNHVGCCYPSAKGHQLIAELLIKTGTEPKALT
jgi:lysophospholipase L1-like esterase